MQTALEDIAFKLRIPQRKPWGAMTEDVAAAAAVIGQRDKACSPSHVPAHARFPVLHAADRGA